MRPILHISDLHIGRNHVTTSEARAALSAIVARWENAAEKPIVVITGDLTQDGEVDQYDIAKQEIDVLRGAGFEVIPVPGNHDYGKMGSHAEARRFGLFKQAFYPKRPIGYPDVIEIDGWTIVCLNTMKAECGFFDGLLADGELGGKQISDLTVLLQALQTDRLKGATKIVVCLHHHPFLFPDESMFEKLGEWAAHWLKDGADLMDKITGKVDVVLFGHDHRQWDFTNPIAGQSLTSKYQISTILSCGTSSGVNDITQHPGPRKAWLIENVAGEIVAKDISL